MDGINKHMKDILALPGNVDKVREFMNKKPSDIESIILTGASGTEYELTGAAIYWHGKEEPSKFKQWIPAFIMVGILTVLFTLLYILIP